MQLFHALAILAAATAVLAAGPSVTTPTTSIISGVPMQVKWSGGSGPYTLVVNTFDNGAQTGVLKTVTGANSPYTFTPPSSAVGKGLQFDVTDSTGAIGQSGGTAKVIAGSGSGGSGSASSGNSASGSSNDASSASSGSAAATSADSSASGSASSSSSAPSSSASTSKSPAGQVRVASAAVAGVVGVAAAALL